jgi:hypothetical protein
MTHQLKLKAIDPEDLKVISAILQDALVLIGDMIYQEDEQRFIMVATRFQWEAAAEGATEFARTATGVSFDGVTAVKRRKINPAKSEGILSLLAIELEEGAIQLEFSEGAAIRLEVTGILCHLQDVGEAWPTPWRPHHPLDEAP